jgi:hypothetical protein
MKFTNSKDGRVRLNISVTYRIGREELMQLVCKRIAEQADHWSDSVLLISPENQFQNQKTLINALKEEFEVRGTDGICYWSDSVSDRLTAAIRQYANEEINRLFPELKEL